MSSPEQQVIITLKDTNRLTAACDACRERKRKCDGKAPCHFCLSRRITCQYSQRKKRGPPGRKKQEENNNVSSALTTIRNTAYSLGAADLEYGISNQTEMNKYINFYVRYMNVIAPVCSAEKLTAPDTNECQVQSYAVVAIASRLCGDIGRSKMCIGSARQLAGTIYDSPQQDAAVAMLLMSSYFQIDLDFPMTSHYLSLSWSLLKLIPINYSDLLYLYIYSNYLVMDNNTTNRQKEQALRNLVNQITPEASHKVQFFARVLSVSAAIFQVFDSNILWPIEKLEANYQKIYNTIVSEQDRLKILTLLNALQAEIEQLGAPDILVQGFRVFTGVLRAIAEWKSGHDLEALSFALQVTESLHILHENNCLGFTADYSFICLLAQMVQYFYEHNYAHQASKLSEFIRIMCRTMGPGYNFVIEFMDQHNFKSNLVESPIIPADPTRSPNFFNTPEFSNTPSPGSISSPYNYGKDQPDDVISGATTENNEGLHLDNLEDMPDLGMPDLESMLTDLDSTFPSTLPLIDLDAASTTNINDPSIIVESVVFP